MPKARAIWAFASVFFISLLLRPPLAAIGPLLPKIQSDLQLSAAEMGLLTSVPVLCFGVGAFAGPRFLRKFGLGNSFTIILAFLGITIATRVWFGFWYLIVATVAMGLGIALSNVLFPTLIRAEFPNSVPKMTAAYTTMLSAFSAIASGIAIPVAAALGSWKTALSLLAIPAAVGLVVWLITVKQTHPVAQPAIQSKSSVNIWRHPLTWAIAIFFGLQSSNFYVLLNWLPSVLMSQGMAPAASGGVVAFMSMIGIPVGMVITANLKRIKSLTVLIAGISVVTSVGLLLFGISPDLSLPASILCGIGLSSSFPLSLALIGMKGSNHATTTSLSAISQGTGYLFAAAAVFVAGISYDVFHSWYPTLIGSAVAAVIQSFAGIYAAKHEVI